MNLVSLVLTRIISTLTRIVRFAVQRFGIGPVVLAAAAVAAAVISWRQRPQNDAHRRRRRSREESTLSPSGARSSANADGSDDRDYGTTHTSPNSGAASRNASRKPQWLTRVRRVSIGAVCSSAQKCNMFSVNSVARCENGSDDRPEDSDVSNANKGEKNVSEISVSPETLPALKKFASLFEVYLVIRVDDDSMERAVTNALGDAGLFENGLLDRRKLVFCETDVGRVSVARQLESHLHIDESIDVVAGLQRFLQCVAFISSDASSFPTGVFGRNVVTYTTLGGFFPHT